MKRLSLTKFAAAVGGVGAAVALTAGAGIASADPIDDAVNTTCTFRQVMAALNSVDPGAAAQVNANGMAKGQLQRFLGSGPVERRAMMNQLAAYPAAQQYVNDLTSVAATCNNY